MCQRYSDFEVIQHRQGLTDKATPVVAVLRCRIQSRDALVQEELMIQNRKIKKYYFEMKIKQTVTFWLCLSVWKTTEQSKIRNGKRGGKPISFPRNLLDTSHPSHHLFRVLDPDA